MTDLTTYKPRHLGRYTRMSEREDTSRAKVFVRSFGTSEAWEAFVTPGRHRAEVAR